MKKLIKYVLVTALLFGCSRGGFTAGERTLIDGAGPDGTAAQGPMRVLVIDDEQDSLFLRRTSREMTQRHLRSPYFEMLCRRMLSTVTDPSQDGVGIAAPQVGVSLALIAVQRFDKHGEPFEFFVNPRITGGSDNEVPSPEGCLSVPGRKGRVLRREWIDLEYLDPQTLETKSERVEGFTAIIFQHETDHLHGRIYTDLLIDEEQ